MLLNEIILGQSNQDEIDKLNSQISSLNSQNSSLRNQISSLNNQVSSLNSTISSLRSTAYPYTATGDATGNNIVFNFSVNSYTNIEIILKPAIEYSNGTLTPNRAYGPIIIAEITKISTNNFTMTSMAMFYNTSSSYYVSRTALNENLAYTDSNTLSIGSIKDCKFAKSSYLVKVS